MAFAPPIGFHLGIGGTARGIKETLYLPLIAAGKKPTVMSADNMGAAVEVVLLGGVAAFRYTGDPFEVPPYWLSPLTAAIDVFHALLARLDRSPEFDRRIWLVTMNEPNKLESPWLGEFCYEFGKLMANANLRWLAPAWAGGEPEPEDWPYFKKYIELCARFPNNLGIATHEYFFTTTVDNVIEYAPWYVNRISFLHNYCKAAGLQMPKVWITEFGWGYEDVPSPDRALANIQQLWYAFYKNYPTLIGASIWYLGGGFDNIAYDAIKIMPPLANWLVNTTFEEPVEPPVEPPAPEPNLQEALVEAWQITADEQIDCGLSLNPQAGLQIAIINFKHPITGVADYIPVHTEFPLDYPDKDNVVVQAGESTTTGDRLLFSYYGNEKILVSDKKGVILATISNGRIVLAAGMRIYPADV